MTNARTKLFLWLALAGVLSIEASLFLHFRPSILEGKADFTSFYAAAHALQQGQGSRLYRVETQREFQQDFAARRTPLLFYHPPFELLLFWPLARLSFPQAYLAWVALNALLLVFLAWQLLPGEESGSGGRARITACFAFAPAFIALLQGQDSILLLLLFTLTYRDLRLQNDGRAGCFLALALFKFQFVLPFVAILLMRRHWRLLPGFAATAAGLLMVSFVLVGREGIADYVGFFREMSLQLAYGTIHPEMMPNLRGAVATLLADDVPAAASFYAVVILSASLLILAAWRWPSTDSAPEGRFDLAFALAVVAAVLA
ncbi:MAG: glycosyltransferase family 87 protein, partial [Terriglobales bacterium]